MWPIFAGIAGLIALLSRKKSGRMESPFLIADASSWQGESPNWKALIDYPGMCGVILKATQGTNYAPAWLSHHWNTIKNISGSRYGNTWFRGAYHFLNFKTRGVLQADYYLKAIKNAGGWDFGDIFPIVDIERGGGNEGATKNQIVETASEFSSRIETLTGRGVILYGRGAMRDFGIMSKMGCRAVWNPSCTEKMATNGLYPAWTLMDIVLWQYTNGKSKPPEKLPQLIPGFGQPLDLSVYIEGANKPTMSSMRNRLTGR